MYRVTIYNGSVGTIIQESSVDPCEPHLYSCRLTEGAPGEIDSLEFTILPNNPGYKLLVSRATLVEVLNTKTAKAEFSGRVLTVTPEMQDSGLIFKSVVCESKLGYLCDSVQPYTEEATYTLEDFFKLLLTNHNAQVEDYKKIYPGTITATASASTGNVTKGLNYQTTWDALKEKLLATEGGEVYLYTGTDGLTYLDYVNELGEQGEQTIELGSNLRSISQEIDPTEIITRLIPLGAKLVDDEGNDTEERLTIASVNNDVIYLDDEDAQSVYGIVEGVVEWDDVTEASNLLTKAKAWLENQTLTDRITLSAIDLSLIGLAEDALERYNYYRIINQAIGLDAWFRVTKRVVNVCDPSDITYEMGSQSKSLASTVATASGNAAGASDAADALAAQLSKTILSLIAAKAQIDDLVVTVATISKAYIDEATINTLLAGYVKTDYLTANYITATDIAAKYVATEYLTTNYLTAASIEAAYTKTTELEATYAKIATLESDYVKTDYLTANYITAEDIRSTYVATTYLTANYITAAEIEAAYTQTTVLEATYATITDLKTVTATAETLTANVATIQSLLAGETVTGELTAIHLTSGTVVIDDALITDAMINSVSASKLTAGTIYTSLITIQTAEDDKSLYITDSLIAMYDANNTQRLQAGMSSETEGYNFVIWDADGTQLFNATGVTASGIPSQTIVNAHVADNAAISGTKLDIESVVSELNEDGSLTVNYANVKINDTTLQYILGEITESTEGDLLGRTSTLETAVETVQGQISSKIWSTDITSAVTEAVDGTVTSAVAYYAVSKSSTYYPTHDDTTAAIVGSMIVGMAVVGNGGSAAWVTEMPEASDGEYVWQSFLITYASGETEWTEPGLLSDAVAREQTTAIAEQYSEVVQTLSKYEVQIGNLQTVVSANYTYLSSQTAELQVSLDEISASLSKTTETVGTLQSEAVTGSVTEYYKSTSSTECTGGKWTTETVEWEEGTYIWMRTTVTNGVGDEAVSVTTDPVCITGNTGATGATGADGEDGEDAVNLIIQSSNGTVFKNAAIATTLSVTIIYGDIIISSARELAAVWADAKLVWQRKMDGEEDFVDLASDDSRLSDSGFLLTLTASDVSTRAVFACTLNI